MRRTFLAILLMVAGLNYSTAVTPTPPTGTVNILAAPNAGIWSGLQRMHAVALGDYTYIGHINPAGTLLVTVWNHATDTFIATRTVKTGFSVDGHNNPALLIEANTHKLWVAYAQHNGSNIYRKISTTSLDTDPDLGDGFGSELGLASQLGGWADYTYPAMVQLISEASDPVYLLYRTHHSNGRLMLSKTTDGTTWDAAKQVYSAIGGNFDPYWKIGSNNADRIDFFVSDGPSSTTNLYHFYYDGSWRTSDGTAMTGKVVTGLGGSDSIAYSDATLVLDDTDGVIDRVRGVAWDGTAPAALAWQKNGTTSRRIVSVRWRSGAWQVDTVVDDVGGFLGDTFQSGCDMKPDDPDVVYASVKVGSSWQMFRYTTADDGPTWTDEQLSDGAGDNFSPVMVDNNAVGLEGLWLFGSYTNSSTWSVGLRGASE
jgi:hypothetical protein